MCVFFFFFNFTLFHLPLFNLLLTGKLNFEVRLKIILEGCLFIYFITGMMFKRSTHIFDIHPMTKTDMKY